jgi:hypothetical protein
MIQGAIATTIITFDKKKERTISLEHDNLFDSTRIYFS